MKALVVYESMYGNTQKIAEAIADGLGGATLMEVGTASIVLPADIDLLVLGGPTHVHGMSRPRTRADAAKQVDGPVISKGEGAREWAQLVGTARPTRAATFDTRVPGPELLTGSAAKGIAKILERGGIEVIDVESFVLDGLKGEPFDRIAPEELERARSWGRALAARMPGPIAVG